MPTLTFLACYEFMLLSSLTRAQTSAGGNSCPLFFLFCYWGTPSHLTHHLTVRPRSYLPCHPASRFSALILQRMKKKRQRGGSPSCCNTWSQPACMNKNYTPISLELKVIRTISLLPELSKHPARVGNEELHFIAWHTSCYWLQQLCLYTASVGCTDQPIFTTFWDCLSMAEGLYYTAHDPGSLPLWCPMTVSDS